MMRIKNILFMFIGLGLSGFLTLLLLEIVLRFLPVAQPLFSQAVTQANPIARFQPNRTVTWSNEWNFAIVTQRHINNDGFANDQDYDPKDPRPLAAVIGDSFIEAMMVAYDETLYGRLSTLTPERRVYSFGMSGAPLSQYLIWAKYAKDTYKPDLLIINIVGNDFDESLPRYASFQNFHQFTQTPDADLTPTLLNEYHPSFWRTAIAQSALARYLFFNLKISNAYNVFKQSIGKGSGKNVRYVNNVAADATDEKIEESYQAIDSFLNLLPVYSGLPETHIILSIDAPRQLIYKPELRHQDKSFFQIMRDRLIQQAQTKGYSVVDMWPAFESHYADNGQRFEFETDSHWNGLGHKVVAEEILKTNAFRNFLTGSSH